MAMFQVSEQSTREYQLSVHLQPKSKVKQESLSQMIDRILLADYGKDRNIPNTSMCYRVMRREIQRSLYAVSLRVKKRSEFLRECCFILSIKKSDHCHGDRVRTLVDTLIGTRYFSLTLRYFLYNLLCDFNEKVGLLGYERIDIHTQENHLLFLQMLSKAEVYGVCRHDAVKAFAYFTQCVHAKKLQKVPVSKSRKIYDSEAYREAASRYAKFLPYLQRFCGRIANKRLRFITFYNPSISIEDLKNDLLLGSIKSYHKMPTVLLRGSDRDILRYLRSSVDKNAINIIYRYLSKKRASVISKNVGGMWETTRVCVPESIPSCGSNKTMEYRDNKDVSLSDTVVFKNYEVDRENSDPMHHENVCLDLQNIIRWYDSFYQKCLSGAYFADPDFRDNRGHLASPRHKRKVTRTAGLRSSIVKIALSYDEGFTRYLIHAKFIKESENNLHLTERYKLLSIFKLASVYIGQTPSFARSLVAELLKRYRMPV